jgi:hypothetical protein
MGGALSVTVAHETDGESGLFGGTLMRAMKAVGMVLAVRVGLVLLYQASQNGRYQPMPFGSGGVFVIMDTRTGVWHLDVPSHKDLEAVRRQSSQ